MTTIGQWLASTGGIDRFDRELLVCRILDISRATLITTPDLEIPSALQTQLDADLERLQHGLPFAYLEGEKEFWGLRFEVTPEVLIPRPETELLVELSITHTPGRGRVLDLGTGSGAVAIAIATERPDLDVTACDIDDGAIIVARTNISYHGVSITVQHSDWLQGLSGRWHTIVSNPPYIAAEDPHLASLSYEPAIALVSGQDGLDAIRHIVSNAGGYLTQDGWLIVEHGWDQAERVRHLFERSGFQHVTTRQDLAGLDRVTLGQRRQPDG